MSNPYSQQHPQQQYESNRGTQSWREDNFNRGQNRSGQQYGQQGNYGQQGGFAQQERYGQQGGQSRYSPNFSGQSEYGQEWQGGNYDDYGYQGNEFDNRQFGNHQSGHQGGQEYSPYSGQGGQEYQPNITPRQNQPIRAENQRWGQGQSRDWQQPWQGRSQSHIGSQFAGNQFGRQQELWPSAQSTFGNHSNSNWGEQYSGLGNQTYGGQQFGTQPNSDRGYGRASFQSSGGQSTGAFGLQQETHRGKGPKGYARTDERIREEISERLSDDLHIDASDITVEVKDGVVTLEGTVQDRTLKHRVEDIADSSSGVKDVHNSLRVVRQASQQQGAEKIQEKPAAKSH
jgi:osmotically-inducible protein OsmY